MKIISLLSGALVALGITSSAGAASFSPASGAIALLGSPMVTIGAGAGIADFSSAASIFATSGSLTAATGSGTVNGTLDFSDIVGTVLPETLTNFMTFTDSSGGNFFFDVSSVKTTAYMSSASSTSITLYLLGTAGDPNLGLTAAPTSETLTINKTGQSAYSASATIAAPPTGGVPEPATWALMLVGFGGAGATLRRSRKAATAVAL